MDLDHFRSRGSICTIFFSSLQFLLTKDTFVTPAPIYTVFLFPFINPAYIYTVFRFIFPASFITPASIYAVLLSLIQLIRLRYSFISPAYMYSLQCSFHQSSIHLSKE